MSTNQEPRNALTISSDVRNIPDTLKRLQAQLQSARNRLAGPLRSSDDPDYVAAVRAEMLPQLAETEARVIAECDTVLAALNRDEQLLQGAGAFTPDLTGTDQAAYPAALEVARVQLETLPPDQVEAAVRAAVMHGNRPQMAAFVAMAGLFRARNLTGAWGVLNALDDARAATQNRLGAMLVEEIREHRQTVQALRYGVVDTANSEEPGAQGSVLDRHVFGGRERAQTRPAIDYDALSRRAGVNV